MSANCRGFLDLEFSGGVIPFVWDRLPLDKHFDIQGREPSLAEDWFVEDTIAIGSQFTWRGKPTELSHRMLYRHARAEAHLRGEFGGRPHWLLWEQMMLLIPLLFSQAAAISRAQR